MTAARKGTETGLQSGNPTVSEARTRSATASTLQVCVVPREFGNSNATHFGGEKGDSRQERRSRAGGVFTILLVADPLGIPRGTARLLLPVRHADGRCLQ